MTLYGYARASTDDQEFYLQLGALTQTGFDAKHIFPEKLSGTKNARPALTSCLSTLKKGDTLLVRRLDRLGLCMPHLVGLVYDLRQRGIGFRSACDGVLDTTTASGELVFNVFSSLAQFEWRF